MDCSGRSTKLRRHGWVSFERLRICMSSSMRCRSGVVDGSSANAPGLFQAVAGSVCEAQCFDLVDERIGGNTRTRKPRIRRWNYRLPHSGLVQGLFR